MKFKEWLDIHEAGRVFNRPASGGQRYVRRNTDLPLNKAPVALAQGMLSSLRQSQEKSGAEFHATSSLPSREDDEIEGGEILNDVGVTHASLPLQIPMTMHNDKPQDAPFSLALMRTVDKMDRKNPHSYNPKQDGLYILWDPNSRNFSQSQAIRHTLRLADEQLKVLMTNSGEINKVDPKPVKRIYEPDSNGVLNITYQFKPKKGGK